MQVIYLLHAGYAYTDYPPVTTYVPRVAIGVLLSLLSATSTR